MTLRLEPLPDEEYAGWREASIARRAREWAVLVAGDVERARAEVARAYDRVLPPAGTAERNEVLVVVDDDRRRGSLGIVWDSATLASVRHLVLDDLGEAGAVRSLVEDRLAGLGATALGLRVVGEDSAAAAFVAGGGFEVVATQMALDLTVRRPGGRADRVRTRPVPAEELERYLATAVEDFADETMRADPLQSRADAVESSRRMFEQILPAGADSPGHDFLVGLDATDGRRVGFLWLFHEADAGFVYDVEVDEGERGRGYGRALMDAAAELCRARDLRVLALNIFGHNDVARALDALGYAVVDDLVQEPLAPGR